MLMTAPWKFLPCSDCCGTSSCLSITVDLGGNGWQSQDAYCPWVGHCQDTAGERDLMQSWDQDIPGDTCPDDDHVCRWWFWMYATCVSLDYTKAANTFYHAWVCREGSACRLYVVVIVEWWLVGSRRLGYSWVQYASSSCPSPPCDVWSLAGPDGKVLLTKIASGEDYPPDPDLPPGERPCILSTAPGTITAWNYT